MPEKKPARVSVRDLAKRYGSVDALRSVSIEVNPGEILGLLGPNGAGKTTLLECILGLRRPDSGAVEIGGIDALARPCEAMLLVGAQIQAASLQDKITPRRVLSLFASFYHAPAGVGALLERFALTEKADAPFDSLSGGQRQRLFLALAFVNHPSVLILDEPTSGLDPRSRRELHNLIAGIRDSGRTVLLSTHDIEEAQYLCDRVAILDRGRMIAEGTPGELVAGSRSTATIELRTALGLEASALAALSGVTFCRHKNGRWEIGTRSVNETLIGIVKHAESERNELLDLRVVGPSLEDVFLSLTGRPWSPGSMEGE